jgi:DNA-directed RNA polymerase specialized sigma24 family protein
LLHVFEEMTFAEIATIFDIEEWAAKMRFSRAMSNIRWSLEHTLTIQFLFVWLIKMLE